MARLDKEWERRVLEDVDKKAFEELEEHERVVQDFELVQMGLKGQNHTVTERPANSDQARGTKRKFELDEQELRDTIDSDRRKMRQVLEAEKKAATKHLPSFWVPSEVPSANEAKSQQLKPPKLKTLCPCSSEDSPHTFAFKTLLQVNFTTEVNESTKKETRICPCCRKTLSNSTKGVLAVPCGHVLCKSCSDRFVKLPETDPHAPTTETGVLRCYVCDANLTETRGEKGKDKREKPKVKPGLVLIGSDGTGFASAGKSEVQRKGVAFQC